MLKDLKDGGVMDYTKAAWALNHATHAVKTKVPLEQRMFFVHNVLPRESKANNLLFRLGIDIEQECTQTTHIRTIWLSLPLSIPPALSLKGLVNGHSFGRWFFQCDRG
ncbi:uncharacterized protein BJ212DRAFT_1588705 [Suillus subaureus]|uniref:Uncharacterized protein n=1 Tax=Suillus subaureus TaxID=48587 RepID=A0A9P7E7Q7_9AGAM|nr:uncharacterized protein BJ212DRAFT_1588705 [Suillus subaureus]KAG1813198.1 hypothetical protein BJ212DRAFT_1588705 [Suillus subaureus]